MKYILIFFTFLTPICSLCQVNDSSYDTDATFDFEMADFITYRGPSEEEIIEKIEREAVERDSGNALIIFHSMTSWFDVTAGTSWGEITFINAGTKGLILYSVTSPDDSVSVSWSRLPIRPLEKGVIKWKINGNTKEDNTPRTIVLVYNNPQPGVVTISNGNISPDIKPFPDSLRAIAEKGQLKM